MFAIAVFGLPYLMSKLIRAMARSQEEEMRRRLEVGAMTQITGENGEQIPIDPKKLDFCRVLYDYTPTPQSGGMDLEAKKGDFVAVLSKTDPMGNASEWWRCRARDGKMGYLPSPYLEPIQRPIPKATPQITEGKATPQMPETDEMMASYKPKLLRDSGEVEPGSQAIMDVLDERDKEYKARYNALYAPATKKKPTPTPAEAAVDVKGPKMDSRP
ncbi:peroxisomal membrane protein, partial [Aspergillus sclerotialis]